jgi:hypothetical protein
MLIALPLCLASSLQKSADPDFEGVPTPGGTLTSRVAEVSVTFADPLVVDAAASDPLVQVRGPYGNFFNLGCAEIDGTTASTSVSLGESGTYEVSWVISPAESGSYTFEYVRAEGAGVSPGTAIPPCDPRPRPRTPASTVSEADMASARQTTAVAVVLIVLVTLSIPFVHIVKRKRRNRANESH